MLCTSRLVQRYSVRALSPQRSSEAAAASKLTQRAYTFIDLRSTHFVSAHLWPVRAYTHLKTQAPLSLSGKTLAARRRATNVRRALRNNPPSNMSLPRRLA